MGGVEEETMSPVVFALIDAWLCDALDASEQMWSCAQEASERPSTRLMSELDAHLAAATGRVGAWRALWGPR